MEDPDVTLSDDDVRERFSALHDGELSPDDARIVRERIAASKTLSDEYEAFKRVMGGLAVLAGPAGPEGPHADSSGASAGPVSAGPEEQPVDLLGDLQRTLHKKSGGKFYRSRASRWVGTRPIEAFAALTLLALVLAYVLMTSVSGLRPAEAPTSPPVAPSR
jgi:anti-sigma factor RsiW